MYNLQVTNKLQDGGTHFWQSRTQVVRWVLQDLHIPFLTVYALSRDNLSSRSKEELQVHFARLF